MSSKGASSRARRHSKGWLQEAKRGPAAAVDGPSVPDPILRSQLVGEVLRHYRDLGRSKDRLRICLRLIEGKGPPAILERLNRLPLEWQDHAIACVYAVLMPHARRKRLGVYFTPPHLVEHLMSRMQKAGLDISLHTIRDPAAGGAAFIVPIARKMTAAFKSARMSPAKIVRTLRQRLRGTEIDAGLAAIANALLRRMLSSEYKVGRHLLRRFEIVRVGDSLAKKDGAATPVHIDHEVGNPPYRRLTAKERKAGLKHFSDISSGRLNLYAMFVRTGLEKVPAGGMVGYVIPASFLGGPDFTAFRRRVLQIASVEILDLVEQRISVFLDAEQDACFLVLRRRATPLKKAEGGTASSCLLKSDGSRNMDGVANIQANGKPWVLPDRIQTTKARDAVLADWGYRIRVGYLVANRQKHRLMKRKAKGRYPLVWAKAIRHDGAFEYARGVAAKGFGWVSAPEDANYIVRTACVVVQRTASRDQRKRLNAAVVPPAFIKKYGGFVGENHVLVLTPTNAGAATPEALAACLNAPATSAELDRISGSASLAAAILNDLPLPPPPKVDRRDGTGEHSSMKQPSLLNRKSNGHSKRTETPKRPTRTARLRISAQGSLSALMRPA